MSYISKPGCRPMLAGGSLRIYNILKDELKMDAAAARELLAEMDTILNDRHQEIIQYAQAIGESDERKIQAAADNINRRMDSNDQYARERHETLKRELRDFERQVDKNFWSFWSPITMNTVYWMLIICIPLILLLAAMASSLKK